jgi:uncharacterized phage protein (TIGR01671 family)
MREILFRGKTTKGEWVYGYHAKFRNYKNEVYSAIIPKDEETGEAYMEDLHPVIHETVGQFTGVTDKNGKKIFEGDIVKFDLWLFAIKGVVEFGRGTFDSGIHKYTGFYLREENGEIDRNSIYNPDEEYENCLVVIGNIHDQDIGEI